MMNTFGRFLRFTSFGESHGPAIGGVLDGMPPDVAVDTEAISLQLHRRSPSSGPFASGRKEDDKIEFLSGISQGGRTLGTPIAFQVRNKDQRPEAYDHLVGLYRPSHADLSWEQKFGLASGPGGGRSSARVLLPAVVAGTLARGLFREKKFSIIAWVSAVGPLQTDIKPSKVKADAVLGSPIGCPDRVAEAEMLTYLQSLKAKGDTAGGIITCLVKNCPPGLGEPVFGKLHADLAAAMMGVNSVKGFEIGSGFSGTQWPGSQYNDPLEVKNGRIGTVTNHDGGINGGISNGADILFRIAFKPVPSVQMEQNTVSREGKAAKISVGGRHDTCVLPRALPIVESLTALVLADHLMMQKCRMER